MYFGKLCGDKILSLSQDGRLQSLWLPWPTVSGGILLLSLGVVSFQFHSRRNKRKTEVPHEPDSSPTPVTVHASTSGLLPEEGFDVFISFRGPGVRTGFVKELDERFRSAGIRPFLDAHDIESGDTPWDSITKVIRGAPICICVCSPRYAESNWCPDELAFILDLSREKIILPVFYNIEPMHMRIPDVGTLSKGLEKVSKRYGPIAASRWRDALDIFAGFFRVERRNNSTDDSKHNSRYILSLYHASHASDTFLITVTSYYDDSLLSWHLYSNSYVNLQWKILFQ